MAKLTVDDAKNWHMQEAAHYNGGKVFFAYLHRCVEQPRLSRFDRYERKDRSVNSTFRVDGQDKASLADAVEALNTPPIFTPDELAFMATVTQDYDPTIDVRGTADYSVMDASRNKGGVEWQDGRCRITEAGRAALRAPDA